MLLKSIIFANMTSYVEGLPFFGLNVTQEQHIGHCESAHQMLVRAFALFLIKKLTPHITERMCVFPGIYTANA